MRTIVVLICVGLFTPNDPGDNLYIQLHYLQYKWMFYESLEISMLV